MTKIIKQLLSFPRRRESSVRMALFVTTAALFLFLFAPNANAGLPIGAECSYEGGGDNGLCDSGDCEKSTIPDGAGGFKRYCDCASKDDCAAAYPEQTKDKDPAWDGDWDCQDGTSNTYDLDYCVKDKDEQTAITDIFTPLPVTNQGGLLDRALAALVDRELVAKTIAESIKADINDQFAFHIPGLDFTVLTGEIDEDGYLYIPWLGEFIKAIYNYGLGIISIVAVIMIILQGARIITSGGGEGKQAGFKKIGQVVIGLIIAWSSYAILYTINTGLTEFKPLKIKYIQTEFLPIEGLEEIETDATTQFHPPVNIDELVDLAIVPGLNAPKDRNGQPKLANTALVTPLTNAIKKFNKYSGLSETTKEVRVNSGLRGGDEQYALMDERCGCPPAEELPDTITNTDLKARCGACAGCSASCSVSRVNKVFQAPQQSHFTGLAVDVSTSRGAKIKCTEATSEEKRSARAIKTNEYGSNYCIPKAQQLLIKAMLENGFCVGLKSTSRLRESWHFELKSYKNSVFCTDNFSDPTLQNLHWLKNTSS